MWDLIVLVPDHCLSFYFVQKIYLTYFSACTCHLTPSDLNTFRNSLYHCSMSITNVNKGGGVELSFIQYL